MIRRFACAVTLIGLQLLIPHLKAQDTEDAQAAASKKIKAAVQSYAAAFNARDAGQLADYWSPDGVYINRTTGRQVTGRDALAGEFKGLFEDKNAPKLALETESIEFISPNVALERGISTITDSEGEVSESRYRVVFVQRDGSWLIDRVTEDDIVVQSSNYGHLKGLEWMIGEWVDDSTGQTIRLACRWTSNQNYISRTFSVSNEGGVVSSGLQIIGWDPRQKRIRSWLFDSNGGHVAGVWTQRDDRWVVQSIATLADGGEGSFTSVFRPLDDGTYGWKKINRVIDGQLLPNLEEVIVQRQ